MDPIRRESGHTTWDDIPDTQLERRAQMYEQHLHMRNFLRMQELLDEESFARWNRLRFAKNATTDSTHQSLDHAAAHERAAESRDADQRCKPGERDPFEQVGWAHPPALGRS